MYTAIANYIHMAFRQFFLGQPQSKSQTKKALKRTKYSLMCDKWTSVCELKLQCLKTPMKEVKTICWWTSKHSVVVYTPHHAALMQLLLESMRGGKSDFLWMAILKFRGMKIKMIFLYIGLYIGSTGNWFGVSSKVWVEKNSCGHSRHIDPFSANFSVC